MAHLPHKSLRRIIVNCLRAAVIICPEPGKLPRRLETPVRVAWPSRGPWGLRPEPCPSILLSLLFQRQSFREGGCGPEARRARDDCYLVDGEVQNREGGKHMRKCLQHIGLCVRPDRGGPSPMLCLLFPSLLGLSFPTPLFLHPFVPLPRARVLAGDTSDRLSVVAWRRFIDLLFPSVCFVPFPQTLF